jgi:hypothetical protein
MRQVVVRMPPHYHDAIVEEAERLEISTAHYIREAAWVRTILARHSRGLAWDGTPLTQPTTLEAEIQDVLERRPELTPEG